MESNITQQQIDFFKWIMETYEPYPFDEPRLDYYDDETLDPKRVAATSAKRILIEYGVLDE